ncbi:MAG: choice-of-anchor I family protein [Bacteroidota bacterium]
MTITCYRISRHLLAALTLLFFFSVPATAQISLEKIGGYETGIFDEGAAEISTYDAATYRLYVTNADEKTIDVLDLSVPTHPQFLFSIDIEAYGGNVNSIDFYGDRLAAAIEADNAQAPGAVVFFDGEGNYLSQVTVGALPDMLTFTPNGRYVLVANEGEPDDDYVVDPEGSVSIIRVPHKAGNEEVRTLGFSAYNYAKLDNSIRIFGPGATVAQDLEPEYIAVSDDSRYAYVALQENNALAIIDIKSAKIVALKGLGFKDHSLYGNGIDASNRDDAINIANWPVYGIYHPDAIDYYTTGGNGFIISANEGDSRDYDGYSEEERIGDLMLDPAAFPNAAYLQEDENLGRLKITLANGDKNGDGYYEKLFAYGARSFSIWDTRGNQVYDSGDEFEQITADLIPDDFNSTNDENDSFDNRSDDKGPEPEGIVVGKVDGTPYAFIGLERVGGIMVYNVARARNPHFVQYVNSRDFSGDAEAGTAGDLAPEGLVFIPAHDSPNGYPLLVVSYEVSGSVAIFQVNNAHAGVAGDQGRDILELQTDTTTPEAFELAPAYPNPFNPSAQIAFSVPEASNVRVAVYNTLGQEVSLLLQGEVAAGRHEVTFNAGNLPSGAYLVRMQTAAGVFTQRVTLLK